MNYKDTIAFLYNRLPIFQRVGKAAYKADLENTLRLDKYFNSPHKNFKSIHIAGTNGKGSVSHMLASIFQEAGYKTGLYTSPHLIDFRERIKTDGVMIPEQEIVDFVNNHKDIIEEIQPSFFEMTVALAFDYFSRMKVDIAIIETGLGGRLDSTNIVMPELSVITNISNDHSGFLGDTILSIAAEKAGIIKPKIPVVIGTLDETVYKLFIEKAAGLNSDIIFAPEIFQPQFSTYISDNQRVFRIADEITGTLLSIETDMLGDYQQENIITTLAAIYAINQKGWKIDQDYVLAGLKSVSINTGLRGRWQVIGENPRIVCDTGHNEAGIMYAVKQILNTPWKNLHLVFGSVDDKDIHKILMLLPTEARYYFARSSIPRSIDHNLLKEIASAYNLTGEAFDTVKGAFEAAKKEADPEDMIFIGGSTFVVADLFSIWE